MKHLCLSHKRSPDYTLGPARLLGLLGYSIYLWHLTIIQTVYRFASVQDARGPTRFWLLLGYTMLMVMGLSVFFYLTVEKPFIIRARQKGSTRVNMLLPDLRHDVAREEAPQPVRGRYVSHRLVGVMTDIGPPGMLQAETAVSLRGETAGSSRRTRMIRAARSRRWRAAEAFVLIGAMLVVSQWHSYSSSPRGGHMADSSALSESYAVRITNGTPTEIRDAEFSGRFRLIRAATGETDRGFALELAWQNIGVQQVAYTIMVQVLDETGTVTETYQKLLDSSSARAMEGLPWLDSFDIPPDVQVRARSLGIVLYNVAEYLMVDRGPRDNGDRRLILVLSH
jgi:hypothetical protein